jgi:iron(III) transport system substrate-binding protein
MLFRGVNAAIAAASAVFLLLLSQPASAAERSWAEPALLDAAKKEGSLIIYTSVNEEEGLPIWKQFEDATGIKVNYVRASDAQLLGRIAIENRASRPTWDLVVITAAHKLPPQTIAQVDPPEAQALFPAARDPNRRWYGFSANYDVPSYNTNLVKPSELPKTYEELARRTDWAGRAAVNEYDSEWVAALLQYYGEDKGRALLKSLGATLKPAIINGHLAVARAVGAGEYAIALTNYVNLTLNMKLAGAATDFWTLDPVALFYMQVSASAQAPHPNAAKLGMNFILSAEGEALFAQRGRIPSRPDVETNPPGVLKALQQRKVMPIVLDPEQERKADAIFKELIAGRAR